MKSIKPGRGPSMMGGIVGIFMVGFGIVWTVIAAKLSGPFAFFGIFWTAIAAAITVYNFKNATNKNRYSSFDITDGNEEPDPLNEHFNPAVNDDDCKKDENGSFCPYCGARVQGKYIFCNKCGKKLP